MQDGETTTATGNIDDPTPSSPTPYPNGKSDICQAFVEVNTDGGSNDMYFGILVNSGQGDMPALVELNQGSARTEGDALLDFDWPANENVGLERWRWESGAWVLPAVWVYSVLGL